MGPLSLFVLLAAMAVAGVLLFRQRSALRRRGLPPGCLGLPFLGETLQLISAYKTANPEPFMDERVGRFGRIFSTHVFGEPTVVSADPEANRFILHNEGRLFECSYPSSLSNLLGRHSLVLMKGPLHRRMHALTLRFAGPAMIKNHLLPDIHRLVRRNLLAWPSRVLLMEEAKKITFELAVKQLMSFDPCEWTERLRKEYVLLIDGFFTLPHVSPGYRRAIKARTKVAEAITVVVRERRAEREAEAEAEEAEKKGDMLEALLSGEEGRFSDEEIVDFLLALLVAGYETTSTIMTLAVKFLTESPAALAGLQAEQEEIKARKKGSEGVEWNDYKSMPFTQCIINETLRVANIIGGIFRRAMEDVEIKGYTIPKGWKVFASFRAVHLDHDHYQDARTFNPWRWQESGVGANVFTPFGGGPRLCPGYELARVELSVFLHHLVTLFSWEAAEEDRLVFFPTTRTQKRYPINLRRRRTEMEQEAL